MLRQPADRELGATATEYVIMLAGIAVVVMIAIIGYGLFLKNTWHGTTTCIESQLNQASCS